MQKMQQTEPPSKMSAFMEKAVLPIITIVIGTVLGTVLGAAFFGKVQVVDFSWLMLLLGAFSFALMGFGLWSFQKATRKSQKAKAEATRTYQEDIVALKQKNYAFEDETTKRVNKELDRLENMFITLSQDVATKQRERFEELHKQCMEAISDAKSTLEGCIINTEAIFSNGLDSCRRAMESQRQSILDTLQPQLDELRNMITTRQSPNEHEDTNSTN